MILPLPDNISGTKVRVYRNLRNGKLSVKSTVTNRVIGHTDSICLRKAKFIVSQKGIDRIRKHKRKIVCAYVEGYLINLGVNDCQSPVMFNPYQWNTFVDKHGLPVKIADKILINASGWMWADGLD